jgi:hypothetical protein
MKYPIPLLVFLFIIVNGNAQTEIDSFRILKAEAPIPQILLDPLEKRYEKNLKKLKSQIKVGKDLEDFALSTAYTVDYFANQGQIIFNDTISKYLEEIADYLLKDDPELAEELQIFTLKSDIPNAFTTPQGLIFFTSGLISQMESEAELAFVMAHEISHYTEKHALKFQLDLDEGLGNEDDDNLNSRNSRRNKDLIKNVHKYKKEQELDADEKGIELLAKSNYHFDAIENTFYVLMYSYLPIEDRKFNKDHLQCGHLHIPDSILYKDYNEITAVEDYDDSDHTHPNIKTRIQESYDIIDSFDKNNRSKFIISEDRFYKVRNLARLSLINNYLVDKNYIRAIYHINMVKNDITSNRFILLSELKALYGLATLFNAEETELCFDIPGNDEGEISYLYNYFSSLSKEGINVIAASKAIDAYKKYPEDTEVKTYFDLIAANCKDYTNIKVDHFNSDLTEKKDDDTNSYDTPTEDEYNYLEDYFNTAFSEEDLQKYGSSFFDGGGDDYQNNGFDFLTADYSKFPYKIYGKFPKADYKNILYISPNYYGFKGYKFNNDLLKSERTKTFITDHLLDRDYYQGIKILDRSLMKKDDIDAYNDLSAIMLWMNDVGGVSSDFDFHSSFHDQITLLQNKYNTNYFSTLNCFSFTVGNTRNISTIDYLFLFLPKIGHFRIYDVLFNQKALFTAASIFNAEEDRLEYFYFKKNQNTPYKVIIGQELLELNNTLNIK